MPNAITTTLIAAHNCNHRCVRHSIAQQVQLLESRELVVLQSTCRQIIGVSGRQSLAHCRSRPDGRYRGYHCRGHGVTRRSACAVWNLRTPSQHRMRPNERVEGRGHYAEGIHSHDVRVARGEAPCWPQAIRLPRGDTIVLRHECRPIPPSHPLSLPVDTDGATASGADAFRQGAARLEA